MRLLTRRECESCAQARRALERLGLEVEEIDVDTDAALAGAYGSRVPVLLEDGRVVAEGHIDAAGLLAALGRIRP